MPLFKIKRYNVQGIWIANYFNKEQVIFTIQMFPLFKSPLWDSHFARTNVPLCSALLPTFFQQTLIIHLLMCNYLFSPTLCIMDLYYMFPIRAQSKMYLVIAWICISNRYVVLNVVMSSDNYQWIQSDLSHITFLLLLLRLTLC